MTGYNAKLIFFRFKLIKLTPKVIKNGIKISLKVSWRIWAAVSSQVKTIHVNYDFLTLLSQPSLSGKHLKIDVI